MITGSSIILPSPSDINDERRRGGGGRGCRVEADVSDNI